MPRKTPALTEAKKHRIAHLLLEERCTYAQIAKDTKLSFPVIKNYIAEMTAELVAERKELVEAHVTQDMKVIDRQILALQKKAKDEGTSPQISNAIARLCEQRCRLLGLGDLEENKGVNITIKPIDWNSLSIDENKKKLNES